MNVKYMYRYKQHPAFFYNYFLFFPIYFCVCVFWGFGIILHFIFVYVILKPLPNNMFFNKQV